MIGFRMVVNVTGYTQKSRAALTRESLDEAVKTGATNVAALIREHLTKKDASEPNRFVREAGGTRRVHFWKQMAEAVDDPQANPGRRSYSVVVRDRRIRQKVYGGPIRPQKAKALAIPVHRDAYARDPRKFTTLTGIQLFILKANGKAFLAGRDGRAAAGRSRRGTRRRGGQPNVTLYFLLSKGVNQKPWPDTMPPKREIRRAFRQGLGQHIMRRRKR